ncbi:MAG: AAA family ATPase, partial [Acidimicrobiia bacterium]|nr:AAA family ATPase [Acidimicrobiia bacterium]
MAEGSNSDGVLDTLTVLFTDIVASTALRAQLGEDVAEVVRRAHDSLIAEIVEGNGGRVVKGMGDGFLATFGSAARAVAAAVGIQQGIDAQRFVEPRVTLALRIGIGLGDVTVEDGDVFGTPVIEAARLCAAADGGQILATSVVEALARSRGGHTFTSVGDLELKGLPDPVATVQISWERATDVAGVPIPHPLAAREGAFPFRGREHALEELTTPWKRSLHAGTTSCVLIAGEPGMGKTRLASEFAQRAHGDGALVLFGRCDEELGISYQPFVEALTHHATFLDGDLLSDLGAHPAELTRLVPELNDRFAGIGDRATSGDAEVDQYRLFEAVDSWLAAAAGTKGLVLVLDDIHWAARPTLLMLRHVLRSSTQARLIIVATYRDTDLDRTHPLADLLADLRRVPEVERIPLGGLDRRGVEDLMEAVNQAELDGSARELAVAVHAETEGNPFFVGELLRHLAESGALVNDGTTWRLTTSVSEMSIPDGIREVVGRRLSRLPESTNAVLSWAAVIGRELRLDVLAAVAGDQDQCLDAIDGAVDAR